MAFYQAPPALANQYTNDRVLQSFLRRAVPAELRRVMEPELVQMGELAATTLYEMQLADRLNEPKLLSWDAWGHRRDAVEVSPLWSVAARLACEFGLLATGYEGKFGALSRIHQFAMVYLFDASTDVYTCPLAMTDGAAKTLLYHQNKALIDRALPRLLSRDPQTAWTSGQWMTERTGGSDVGLSETIARSEGDGTYRLHGTKWFTSATTANMALTLARPEGNASGGSGLALFYVERELEDGPNRIYVNRLKDKLGTRKVPTAELLLDGALAHPVAGTHNGIRNISPMLNVTRTWNAVCATAAMRRGIALARDYAAKRVQFGSPLSEKPLHADTLAGMQAEFEGAFHLAFFVVELLGREEHGLLTEQEHALLRLLTPLAKLLTAKQSVSVISEVLECFGGAGYVEDTGLPRLLRDAQVLPIWEGTTNVLSLDALKVLAKRDASLALKAVVWELTSANADSELENIGQAARFALDSAISFFEAHSLDLMHVEASARRIAMSLGRTLELALLVRHASWAIQEAADDLPKLAARRFLAHGLGSITGDFEGASRLALS